MAPSGSAIFRSLLVGIAGVLVSSVATGQTPADPPYPGQAVRLVVPFSAGSVTDLLARIIGEKLGERWGQQLIVENRPGIPGTASVAKSAPDGYTLMLTSNGHTVAAVLNKNLPFDPVREFSGVTQVASVPLVLIVPPDSPATTLRELVALAKDRPGALNFASSGLASTAYISGELFKQTAKLDIVHVPYKGAPESLTGIMRADSHMFFAGINIALDLIQSGKVRPLAVAASKRIATLPAVPTFAEAGMPEFEYDAWFGVMAPTNTPIAIRTKVGHSYIKQIMAESGAVFGGEHSAHYYFRDNYRADSGIIATMLVLEQLSQAGAALSTVRKPFERYAASGEINTAVPDPSAVMERVAAAYSSVPQDRLDGLTVDSGRWWFNLRPSNTEPLLRLNLEADDRGSCDQHVAEVLALITEP